MDTVLTLGTIFNPTSGSQNSISVTKNGMAALLFIMSQDWDARECFEQANEFFEVLENEKKKASKESRAGK